MEASAREADVRPSPVIISEIGIPFWASLAPVAAGVSAALLLGVIKRGGENASPVPAVMAAAASVSV